MRPRASEENKAIALAFAKCVTVQASADDFVARHGTMSLFFAFEQIRPDLIRDANDSRPGNRQGISEPEFNKLLEREEGALFIRRRRRCSSVRKAPVDVSAASSTRSPFIGTGSWMFVRLRWRDPDCSEDLADLQSKMTSLDGTKLFEEEKLITIVRKIRRDWLHLLHPPRTSTPKGSTSPQLEALKSPKEEEHTTKRQERRGSNNVSRSAEGSNLPTTSLHEQSLLLSSRLSEESESADRSSAAQSALGPPKSETKTVRDYSPDLGQKATTTTLQEQPLFLLASLAESFCMGQESMNISTPFLCSNAVQRDAKFAQVTQQSVAQLSFDTHRRLVQNTTTWLLAQPVVTYHHPHPLQHVHDCLR
jgi:hypothetical protein